MKWNDNRRIRYYFIDNKGEIHVFKKKKKKNIQMY